ncbi:MAG TPA: TolC family protein [Thermoanaerobaculia bacterium]
MKREFCLCAALALAASPTSAQQLSAPSPSLQPAPAPAPISLALAQSTALRQVSALQQAQIDEAIAAEDLRQAEVSLLPRARSASTITYNSPARPPVSTSDPSFIASNAIHEYQELLGVTGEWNFGFIAGIRRARAMLRAARAGTEIARRAFVRGVSEAYYGAALATAKRRAAETSFAAAEEFERVTDLNFHAGEVPEIDVIRARLQSAQRRDDLAQARQAETVANATLSTLLGTGITGTPNIEPLPQTITTTDIQSITAESVQRRPEFVQLEAQLQAARADVGVARADRLPRIIYSVDEGFDTNSLSADQIRQHRGLLATANIDIPIFDWGLTRSRQRQAELRAQSATLQQQLVIRDLYLQFATARQEATTAAERVDNARRALADAERNLTVSISRYRAGEGPITEVTDAQTTLANQRLTLQQALYDYQIARAHLLEAVGQ